MFTLPELPFDVTAVERFASPKAFEYHHGKHHKKYVENLNKLTKGTKYANVSVEELCNKKSGKIFENAAQHWNHSFYWQCIAEDRKSPPAVFETLEDDFVDNGMKIFGSGWWWIAWHREDAEIRLHATKDAGTLGQETKGNYIPLLVADVWEHAYYIDYYNDRQTYLERMWKQFNWDFAMKNLERAKKEDKKWTL